ncbi:di-heme oxidoredictase family protein [Endozoicomonas sp. SCSIO W0465]|uniref:di-heme oxidoreductase family protein n=1 Tax=Endozoicomonas sp. SCSIO W0465 TaxID=2918516 RepID=UPI002075E123|nr:di-heme oxidoredictase family protein [Endozoicomonas sp. SCSIO W0465]USE38145.1 c-type cytochrome [Endozoicomonas sp. SCSIO W0465]
MQKILFLLAFNLIFLLAGCDVPKEHQQPAYEKFQVGEDRPGGDASVNVTGFNTIAKPSANMPVFNRLNFHKGNALFRQIWQPESGADLAVDGLGPMFHTTSCSSCHIHDRRGHAPEDGEITDESVLVRLSIPAISDDQKKRLKKSGVIPEPTYGGQLQVNALEGVKPEGQVRVTFEYFQVTFADGHQVELRKPLFTVENLGYGPMAENTMLSMRITPSMIGIGLLEAISEKSLLANEDPEDSNGDGISGRVNRVWDIQKQRTSIGRFGWKAGVPTLRQQSAAAFSGDMGLTTSLFPDESCTKIQKDCLAAPSGEESDVSDLVLDKIVFYSRNVGVPVRTNAKRPEVLKGKTLFNEAGCAGCHQPSFRTASLDVQSETAMTVIEKEQANQLIWPYSDFLLHDMGEGLADGRPEFLATGSEWRTPALWGIGHTQLLDRRTGFLHDGRARSLMEAILWHGGEAQQSRSKVLKMSADERKALVTFIESL